MQSEEEVGAQRAEGGEAPRTHKGVEEVNAGEAQM